jgi:predicted dehydrogenase
VGRLAVLPALAASPTARLQAIASRDPARAEAEARNFSAERAYGGYEALLADPDVDAVYIPLPNGLHCEWTLKAAAAGKHVLCEKPLACSAGEVMQMADACRRAGVVLMEGYMTAFHQRHQAALQLVRSGGLGRPLAVRTAFTFPASDPDNHRWQPELGGGSLLDVGVYCLAPVLTLADGPPVSVAATMAAAPSGVDASCSGWLAFESGLSASFLTSFAAPEEQLLEVVGSEARMHVERAFTAGAGDREIWLAHRDGRSERIDIEANDSYRTMVEHFAEVVAGRAEPLRTVADSIATLELLDRLRAEATIVPASL